MTNKVREQIFVIRNTGLTNMFDVNTVQRMAHEMNFFELVVFLEEHKDQYVRFILTGEEQQVHTTQFNRRYSLERSCSLCPDLSRNCLDIVCFQS